METKDMIHPDKFGELKKLVDETIESGDRHKINHLLDKIHGAAVLLISRKNLFVLERYQQHINKLFTLTNKLREALAQL